MPQNDQTLLEKTVADQWKILPSGLTVIVRPMPGYSSTHVIFATRFGSIDRDFRLDGKEVHLPAGVADVYKRQALGAAFHPYFVGGTFDPEAVGIEKQMLKKALEDEINDKRLYCLHQANREFFGDSPAGVRQEGDVYKRQPVHPGAGS